MDERFSRTALLIGEEGVAKLAQSSVAVFGVGGVGSFAAEGLARAGIGRLVLVDSDVIAPSNINRQIHALTRTIGMPKVAAMRARICEINPRAEVIPIQKFYLPENAAAFFDVRCDYIVDAIDTVTGKIDLAVRAAERGIPAISSMGAGNKLDPGAFEIADIYETSVCPLARVMRRELRQRGVQRLKVAYSREKPLTPSGVCPDAGTKRQTPGSISFVPPVVGLLIAGEVVRDLLQKQAHRGEEERMG